MSTKLIKAEVDQAIADMVNSFLKWPLPEGVSADPCATRSGKGRTGTNLLTCPETVMLMQEVVRPRLEELLRDWPFYHDVEPYDRITEKVSEHIWKKFQQNYETTNLPDWENCAPLARLNTRSYARVALEAIGIVPDKQPKKGTT